VTPDHAHLRGDTTGRRPRNDDPYSAANDSHRGDGPPVGEKDRQILSETASTSTPGNGEPLHAVLLGGPLAGLVLTVPAHLDFPTAWYGPGHTDIRRFGCYRLPDDSDVLRRVRTYTWIGHEPPSNETSDAAQGETTDTHSQ
jgi:hypothetical protein